MEDILSFSCVTCVFRSKKRERKIERWEERIRGKRSFSRCQAVQVFLLSGRELSWCWCCTWRWSHHPYCVREEREKNRTAAHLPLELSTLSNPYHLILVEVGKQRRKKKTDWHLEHREQLVVASLFLSHIPDPWSLFLSSFSSCGYIIIKSRHTESACRCYLPVCVPVY